MSINYPKKKKRNEKKMNKDKDKYQIIAKFSK